LSKIVYTVFIADDHQIVIDGITSLLNSNPELEIIGSANNGEDAYNKIKSLRPDIAILDIEMPGMTGIQVIGKLVKKLRTKFIVLSMFGQQRHIKNALHAGASGFLPKNLDKNELLQCVDLVLNGKTCFPELVEENETTKSVKLSNQEINILRLLIKGLTNQQIAAMLKLSIYTVETHRKNIQRKVDTKSLVGLIEYAKDNGITAE
jgi:DNA-binding NarL/FixJ family response regulator